MNAQQQQKTIINRQPQSPLKLAREQALLNQQHQQEQQEQQITDADREHRAVAARVKSEFAQRFDNLEKDIVHIDARMQHIQQFCTNLDAQVQNLQQLVKSDNNPGKKGQYYQIMNSCMELNATYEMLYIRCMELKQRYRKEQDDLHSKISRFTEVEIPKSKVDVSEQALTPASLAIMMQELTSAITNSDKKAEKIHTSLQELEDNPDYKI